jgi:hypothetical protein
MNRNLTAAQKDYAYFLPATSGFYSTFIGKQRYGHYVDPARIPKSFTNGIEGLNYLEPDKGAFYYDHCLYSAGHANLDLTKADESEAMFRNRDRSTSWVLGDSGGFQIGKGVWEGEWRDPNGPEVQAMMASCIAKGIELVPQFDSGGNPKLDKTGKPKTTKIDHVKKYQASIDAAQKKRALVLGWMDALMDYGMVLDIPAWVCRSPSGIKATGVSTYQEAVNATRYNNEYFIKHRNNNCKFLNVLQGENHSQADDWYLQVKDFCDTAIYGDKAFNGWGMGGQNMCDVKLVLKRVVALRYDGLLEKGQHDWMHFLGTSKLEWATLLTDIQRAVRKYHNDQFTISFDCASPFLATANGQIYIQTETQDRTKWVYRMVPSADDKRYSTDTRLFQDAVVQDKIFKNFDTSPIMDGVEMKSICIYGNGTPNWANVNADNVDHAQLFVDPILLNDTRYWTVMGDMNKINKVGRTSWDSFSYAIQMGHNVWSHLNAVQEANRQYDAGNVPAMLVQEKLNRVYFRDVVDEIFAAPDRATAEALIEKHDKFWDAIIGTRGATGKKAINASTHFANLFDEVGDNSVQLEHDDVFSEDETTNLDNLENDIK